jgi:hypothetical protein
MSVTYIVTDSGCVKLMDIIYSYKAIYVFF